MSRLLHWSHLKWQKLGGWLNRFPCVSCLDQNHFSIYGVISDVQNVFKKLNKTNSSYVLKREKWVHIKKWYLKCQLDLSCMEFWKDRKLYSGTLKHGLSVKTRFRTNKIQFSLKIRFKRLVNDKGTNQNKDFKCVINGWPIV